MTNWSESGTHANAVFGEPFPDNRRLMGGVVIHDEIDVEFARHGSFDLVDEPAELSSTVPSVAFANNPSCRDVEGGEQEFGAVPLVVTALTCRLAGTHRSVRSLRSSAWIWDFLSTHGTMACSGGET